MERLTESPLIFHLVVGLAIVVVFWLLTGVARRGLLFLGRRVFARTATVLDDRVLDVLLSVLRPLMIVIGLEIAVQEVRKGGGGDTLA
jgi:hypothetical protein